MSKPTKGPHADHFSPSVCEAACACFSQAYFQFYGKRVNSERLPSLRSGPHPSPVLELAWKSFQQEFTCNGTLIAQRRECDREAYRHVVRTHWKDYFLTRRCPHPTFKKDINLTDEETRELAHLAAKRIKHEAGTFVAHQRLAAVGKAYPRAQQLIDKADATEDALHDHLLKNVKELRYIKEDVVYEHAKGTAQKRQRCAEILRGDAPWFKRPCIDTREHSTSDGAKKGERDVYWKQEYWAQHVFVLDATQFCNRRTDEKPEDDAPLVYVMESEPLYPAREIPRPKSISQSTSLMVYALFHKYLGLIVGPDLVFTGTKLPQLPKSKDQEKKSEEQKLKDKEQQFEDLHLKTWYEDIRYCRCCVMCQMSVCLSGMLWLCRLMKMDKKELHKLDVQYGYPHRNQTEFTVRFSPHLVCSKLSVDHGSHPRNLHMTVCTALCSPA